MRADYVRHRTDHLPSTTYSRSSPTEARGRTGVLMKSSIIKRSVVIGGHKTSVSSDLKKIAHAQAATLSELVAEIGETRQRGNLSSAIRLFVLEHIRLVK